MPASTLTNMGITANGRAFEYLISKLMSDELEEVRSIVIEHVKDLHRFYGEFMGVRFARKHVSWYMQTHEQGKAFRSIFNALEQPTEQLGALNMYFDNLT
mgnify:CR=1 FL=1